MNLKTCLAAVAFFSLSACAADQGHRMMAGEGCQMMSHGKAGDAHAKGEMPKGKSMDGCGMKQEKDGPRRGERHPRPSR